MRTMGQGIRKNFVTPFRGRLGSLWSSLNPKPLNPKSLNPKPFKALLGSGLILPIASFKMRCVAYCVLRTKV